MQRNVISHIFRVETTIYRTDDILTAIPRHARRPTCMGHPKTRRDRWNRRDAQLFWKCPQSA